ncbi:MAG: zinc-ribbon domain containing protein [Bacillota bacterium]
MFSDKVLKCKDCGVDFVFSASEQEFYAQKGFTNNPGRCPKCRSAKKSQYNAANSRNRGAAREMFSAVCSSCGKRTSVPFQPSGDKPVYCQDCYQPRRRNSR